MLKVPTTDDWYALALRYPDYMKVSNTTLKDYGHMACMEFIENTFGDRGKDIRILEFGHGIRDLSILERFQSKHEVWGADRDQGLHYFADVDWESAFASVAKRCPDVKFVRELLTSATPAEVIPDDYFDCIISVSVLEEVEMTTVQDILHAAAKKLRTGGYLIGTHDLNMQTAATRLGQYIEAHREVGLDIGVVPSSLNIDWVNLFLENPTVVMLRYQMADPKETRRYGGHFATAFTVAQNGVEIGSGQSEPMTRRSATS